MSPKSGRDLEHHRLNLAFHFSSESVKASHVHSAKLDENAGTVVGRLKTTNSREELESCKHLFLRWQLSFLWLLWLSLSFLWSYGKLAILIPVCLQEEKGWGRREACNSLTLVAREGNRSAELVAREKNWSRELVAWQKNWLQEIVAREKNGFLLPLKKLWVNHLFSQIWKLDFFKHCGYQLVAKN